MDYFPKSIWSWLVVKQEYFGQLHSKKRYLNCSFKGKIWDENHTSTSYWSTAGLNLWSFSNSYTAFWILYILATFINVLWGVQGDNNSPDRVAFMAVCCKGLQDTKSTGALRRCPDGSYPLLHLPRLAMLRPLSASLPILLMCFMVWVFTDLHAQCALWLYCSYEL